MGMGDTFELGKHIYVIDSSNKLAMSAMQKLSKRWKPSRFPVAIPVNHEEFEALKQGVIRVEMPDG